jgi:hypothetical protein
MAWQIIKLPSKNYGIFSSVIDDFIYIGADREGIVHVYKEEFGKRGVENVEDILKKLDEGAKPYYQFTMDFLEAVKLRNMRHDNNFDGDPDDGNKYIDVIRNELSIIGVTLEQTFHVFGNNMPDRRVPCPICGNLSHLYHLFQFTMGEQDRGLCSVGSCGECPQEEKNIYVKEQKEKHSKGML